MLFNNFKTSLENFAIADLFFGWFYVGRQLPVQMLVRWSSQCKTFRASDCPYWSQCWLSCSQSGTNGINWAICSLFLQSSICRDVWIFFSSSEKSLVEAGWALCSKGNEVFTLSNLSWEWAPAWRASCQESYLLCSRALCWYAAVALLLKIMPLSGATKKRSLGSPGPVPQRVLAIQMGSWKLCWYLQRNQ